MIILPNSHYLTWRIVLFWVKVLSLKNSHIILLHIFSSIANSLTNHIALIICNVVNLFQKVAFKELGPSQSNCGVDDAPSCQNSGELLAPGEEIFLFLLHIWVTAFLYPMNDYLSNLSQIVDGYFTDHALTTLPSMLPNTYQPHSCQPHTNYILLLTTLSTTYWPCYYTHQFNLPTIMPTNWPKLSGPLSSKTLPFLILLSGTCMAWRENTTVTNTSYPFCFVRPFWKWMEQAWQKRSVDSIRYLPWRQWCMAIVIVVVMVL